MLPAQVQRWLFGEMMVIGTVMTRGQIVRESDTCMNRVLPVFGRPTSTTVESPRKSQRYKHLGISMRKVWEWH